MNKNVAMFYSFAFVFYNLHVFFRKWLKSVKLLGLESESERAEKHWIDKTDKGLGQKLNENVSVDLSGHAVRLTSSKATQAFSYISVDFRSSNILWEVFFFSISHRFWAMNRNILGRCLPQLLKKTPYRTVTVKWIIGNAVLNEQAHNRLAHAIAWRDARARGEEGRGGSQCE